MSLTPNGCNLRFAVCQRILSGIYNEERVQSHGGLIILAQVPTMIGVKVTTLVANTCQLERGVPKGLSPLWRETHVSRSQNRKIYPREYFQVCIEERELKVGRVQRRKTSCCEIWFCSRYFDRYHTVADKSAGHWSPGRHRLTDSTRISSEATSALASVS